MMMCQITPTPSRRRQLPSLALLFGLCAGLLLPAAAGATPGAQARTAAAVATGPLAIEPRAGDTETGEVRLVTAQLCPDRATNYLVRISGAGFPTGSNAIGNEALELLAPTYDGNGLVVPLWGTWQMVADVNGVTNSLDGVATLAMVCMDKFGGEVYAANVGKVEFTARGRQASSYAQADGPTLASGQPRTPQEFAAIARNDGSFPPPNRGEIEIVQAPAPAIQGVGGSGATGPTDPSAAGPTPVAPLIGDSDVRSDPVDPGSAPDLLTTSSVDDGAGGMSTGTLLGVVLLLVLMSAGGLMLRAAFRSQ